MFVPPLLLHESARLAHEVDPSVRVAVHAAALGAPDAGARDVHNTAGAHLLDHPVVAPAHLCAQGEGEGEA